MSEHPVRKVVTLQGRSLRWVAGQLNISANYLHRILLPDNDADHRTAPEWFYPRLSQLLGVPEDMLRPEPKEPVAA